MSRQMTVVAMAFVAGTMVGVAAQKRGVPAATYQGKPPAEAAAALLPLAKTAAEDGSWENIFVGRVHYLGGQKEAGQAIFDAVTARRKVEASDWFRIGKVYFEAGEWDRAKAAFEKVLTAAPDDTDWLAEIGAYYNLKGERDKAEELFGRSFAREANNVWNLAKAGGSYLGVVPQ
jgi:tetratricopeptide (TPR) repeat protein